jgi:RNA polymerase sigma-70 factor (ECF subfamily)
MANNPASPDAARSSDFERFFRENYSSLWRYVARRVPRAKTDDVVSTSFIVAWEKYSTVDNPSLPWLIRVASFEIANVRRKQGREGRHEISIVIDGFAAPSGDDFDGSSVRSAMARLSESEQEILRLVLWDELPREDIGLILSLSINAVNVRYHRALQKFERSVIVPRHTYPVKDDPNAN